MKKAKKRTEETASLRKAESMYNSFRDFADRYNGLRATWPEQVAESTQTCLDSPYATSAQKKVASELLFFLESYEKSPDTFEAFRIGMMYERLHTSLLREIHEAMKGQGKGRYAMYEGKVIGGVTDLQANAIEALAMTQRWQVADFFQKVWGKAWGNDCSSTLDKLLSQLRKHGVEVCRKNNEIITNFEDLPA
ncbi:MAG: hypothetical protein AAGH99_01170 [Planctomycetota bacterium]